MEGDRLEWPAEVWEAFKRSPSPYTLVWKGWRKVFVLSAVMERVQTRAVEVLPAAYRLRLRGLAGEERE